MFDSEKTMYGNVWRNYWEQNNHLGNHRGQAYSLILRQCTQLIQDIIKQKYGLECDKHLLQSFDSVTINIKENFGTDGRQLSVCHFLFPETYFLHVPPGIILKPAMVQEFWHKGWYYRVNWCDTSIKSSFGVCGERGSLTDFWCMYGSAAIRRSYRLQRTLSHIRYIYTECNTA